MFTINLVRGRVQVTDGTLPEGLSVDRAPVDQRNARLRNNTSDTTFVLTSVRPFIVDGHGHSTFTMAPGSSHVFEIHSFGIEVADVDVITPIESQLRLIEGLSTLIDSITGNDEQTIDRAQVLRLRAFGVGLEGAVREIRRLV